MLTGTTLLVFFDGRTLVAGVALSVGAKFETSVLPEVRLAGLKSALAVIFSSCLGDKDGRGPLKIRKS